MSAEIEGCCSDGDPRKSRALSPEASLPWKWWALRAAAVQQRILSGPAAALQADIEQLTQQVIGNGIQSYLTVSRSTHRQTLKSGKY